MKPKTKLCSVRMSEELHSEIKCAAYKNGQTLQNYVIGVMHMCMYLEKTRAISWLCEACGSWDLRKTQMAHLRDCEKCGKKEVATFPCEDK